MLRRSWRRPVRTAWRVLASMVRVQIGRPFATSGFDTTGTRAVVDLRTPFGKWLYRYGGPYTDPDFDILRRFLAPGDVFVDCGANVGHFTLTAAPMVGPSGRVIAFEPSPDARASLERSVAANGFRHVTVLPYALGARRGEATFVLMGGGDGLSSFAPAERSTGRETTVQVDTLDDVVTADLLPRVSLVKMDIEGAEASALAGAERLLRDGRAAFLVEIEDEHLRRQGSSAAAVRDLFEGYGYTSEPTPGSSPNELFTRAPRPSP